MAAQALAVHEAMRVDHASEFLGRAVRLPPRSLLVAIVLARSAHGASLTLVGVKIDVASTKAFTGRLVCLALLAVRLGVARSALASAAAADLPGHLLGLPALLDQVFRVKPAIDAEAHQLVRWQSALSRGVVSTSRWRCRSGCWPTTRRP